MTSDEIFLLIAKKFAEEIQKPFYGNGKNLTPHQLKLLFHNGFNAGLEAGINLSHGESND